MNDTTHAMRATRYPGYDVLDKRDTPSWDEATRAVIAQRLATPAEPHFFNAVEWLTVCAVCACIVPQANAQPVVPLAQLLDAKLVKNTGDGYRDARLPPLQQAWRTGLAALDVESRARHGLPFGSLDKPGQHALLDSMQRGELTGDAWNGMPAAVFFAERLLHDICGMYYAHPHAWSEMGFGGPANPRGYVRLYYDRRDPWEAAEAKRGDTDKARKENQRAR
ncbi:gluconate 2-dehydrogenase subunit 3-like protein [Paraburkholderia sp. BL6669N2]|uniref:gluconate 2-dehydrogenase subunit 3 family protein n=1 Tax=Paraburkholderia sp. BL6669N2 TaxID=1938807 RepID=UPI000E265D2A|nr:gluconate 2-dehydrogenase subunit 3 family protein [Paraburkholderia sp. BL6669N2]REG48454.1 gluconate 2-dehydrogenase subunit 3-like protein [Paraburkholderia sp. BL6669N2]